MSTEDAVGNSITEFAADFEKRKIDHINLALDPRTEARGLSHLDQVQMIPDALPDFNFDEVSLDTRALSINFKRPYFVSSMTAGHANSFDINLRLAKTCSELGILFGVGSQRRELTDDSAKTEWIKLRAQCPDTIIFGNLGIAQVIEAHPDKIIEMLKPLEANGIFVHLNALQEVLQINGTPNFAGSYKAISVLKEKLKIPLVVKEVGSGISLNTLSKLEAIGVDAVDVAGSGGTHWGRVEGLRSDPESSLFKAAEVFKDWGISAVESLSEGAPRMKKTELWASGGVRSGLDVAKLLGLEAKLVGIARPVMAAIISNDESSLSRFFDQIDLELKTAMFCSGAMKVAHLKHKARYNSR